MIVCELCGEAVHRLGSRCTICSGKGIEKATPFKSLLTPTQRKGSPDRWSQSYTTPPQRLSGSPLARQATTPLAARNEAPKDNLDLRAEPGVELARVCGTVFDGASVYPHCSTCDCTIMPNTKLYLAPRNADVPKGATLCRLCYSKAFALGTCYRCQQLIVGDRQEGLNGAHVTGRGGSIWHAACFTCEACGVNLYRQDHTLSVSGAPTCITCIDSAGGAPGLPAEQPRAVSMSPRKFRPPGFTKQPLSTTPAVHSPVATRPGAAVPVRPTIRSSVTSAGSVRQLTARYEQAQHPEDPLKRAYQ